MVRLAFRGTLLRLFALVLVEHALIVLSVLAAAAIRFGLTEAQLQELVIRAVFIAAVLQVCLHYCDLYDLRTLSERRDLITGLIRAIGAASLLRKTR